MKEQIRRLIFGSSLVRYKFPDFLEIIPNGYFRLFTWTAGMHLALQQTIPVPTIAKNVPIKPATMLNNRNARLYNGLLLKIN